MLTTILIILLLLLVGWVGVYWSVKHPGQAKQAVDIAESEADKITEAAKRAAEAAKKAVDKTEVK